MTNTPNGAPDNTSLLQPGETLGAAVTAPASQPQPNEALLQPGETLGPVQQAPTQPTQTQQPQDTGVWAAAKRNTVGAITGIYHAFTDPVTPEESAQLLQKIRDYNQSQNVKDRLTPMIPESSAQNPSTTALAYHRILDAPAETLLAKGKDETEAAKDLLEHHEYWKGGNLYLSGLADRALSRVPLVGPMVNSIAERGEGALVPAVDKQGNTIPLEQVPENRKDFSGAATDVAAAYAAEHARAVVGKVAGKVGEVAEKVAPKAMNSLLKANKPVNYLYGKNPGMAFIDENIKLPKDSISFHGQLENLHGQLETAQDNLSNQLKSALSEPSVAAKRIDIVPDIKSAIQDAKKYISKQAGLDVPKYTEELNKLQDSILTRYDEEGNPTGKITETKMSPLEVADVKKSIGKNTQWRVLPTDPDIQLKSYLNSVRKRIYGQLADTVEQAAPNADVKGLNQRLANSIEAQGLLEKRLALEAGTGGVGAFLRHGELLGALTTLMSSGITGDAGLTAAAGLALDTIRRTPIARLATARGTSAVGKSLQSGVGQGGAQAAGTAALAAPVVAQLPNRDEDEE